MSLASTTPEPCAPPNTGPDTTRHTSPGAGLAARQAAFTAAIRDPRSAPPPEVSAERLTTYRELMYNNVESFLASGFPVLRRISDDAWWHALVGDFFASHRCQTPLFLEIGEEFLAYLEEERGARPGDPPFLGELAHYERVELTLTISEAELPSDGIDPQGDLLRGHPLLSPLARRLAYRYPVQLISPNHLPETPPEHPTHLLVYRDRHDRVGFLELNPVTVRLLEQLEEEPAASGEEVLTRIAAELNHPHPEQVVAGGLEILAELRRRDVVLGTRTGEETP